MENLNAENIINEIQSLIKALKDCGGWVKRGNGEGWFNHEILADALALINSQEQRIKELTEENERLSAERDTFEIYYKDYKHKNKELTAFNRRWAKECAELQEECEYIKADTVSEIRARVAVHFGTYCDKDQVKIADVFKLIDQIAKEMLEGENEN